MDGCHPVPHKSVLPKYIFMLNRYPVESHNFKNDYAKTSGFSRNEILENNSDFGKTSDIVPYEVLRSVVKFSICII
jgi:hypothetical protein